MNTRLSQQNEELKKLASDAHRRMDRMEDYLNQKAMRKDPNRLRWYERDAHERYIWERQQQQRMARQLRDPYTLNELKRIPDEDPPF